MPAASTTPEPGAADDKWCAGTDIVFFPGGSQGDSISAAVYNGALAAAADLGANVSYVWSDWDPQKMVAQFLEAAGHPAGWHCDHGASGR